MENYDVIIIGGGIAGLGAGSILQEKGLKTVVLERGRVSGGRCRTFEMPGGWKVDSGTHCIDDADHSACSKLLARLGKEIPWSRNLQGFMFYAEGSWKPMMEYLEMTEGDKKQLAEFEDWIRNIGDAEIDELDKVSLNKLIRDKGLSASVADYARTIGMVHTTLTDADRISAGEFAYIYRGSLIHAKGFIEPFSGVRMPLGGIRTLIKALEDAYRERGGTLLLDTTVVKVNVKSAQQFEIVTNKESYKAPKVIVAAPIWNMLDILPMDELATLAPEWAARIRTMRQETSSSMGFTIGTRAPLLDMPYYISAWRLPGVGLPMQVLLHTNFDNTIAPKDHTIAFIGACCTPEQALNKEFREKTLVAFWEVVKQMFPNVEQDLVWRKDAYIVGIDGLARSPGMTGKLRPPVYLPEISGLYFAGDCYTGRGIGMNAAADSAMICAEAVLSGK